MEPPTAASRRSADAPASNRIRRVVAASMAGTVVEWYEFFLYATAASLVFGTFFFPRPARHSTASSPRSSPTLSLHRAPPRRIVFGQIGDRFGRKPTLQATIIIVGVATFLMGCLPGFASVGYWAPAMLVALRFIQGFAVGGEWGGAVLLVAEQSPDRRRAFWSSWPQAAVPVGNLLATLVLLITSFVLSPAAFLDWAGASRSGCRP